MIAGLAALAASAPATPTTVERSSVHELERRQCVGGTWLSCYNAKAEGCALQSVAESGDDPTPLGALNDCFIISNKQCVQACGSSK